MKHSTDRILTTHVGSLARPTELLETMREKENGRPYDAGLFGRQVRSAVMASVAAQADAGLDVVTDGEQGKVSFVTYVLERLTGFSSTEGTPLMPASWLEEARAFPEYYDDYFAKYRSTVTQNRVMNCIAPVRYAGRVALRRDLENLAGALGTVKVEEAFVPSTSPSGFGRNEYYRSEEEYLVAIAEAMREEYLAIVDAGFLVQIDDPWLIEILSDPGTEPEQRQVNAARHVEILNHALRAIPADRIRLHTCYGLNHGPRVHDLPLADVVPWMLKTRAGGYSFEVANPRHAHEWRVWERTPLPDDAVLIPGFIGHATSYVEHPQLIADSIVTYARLVGRENVIAGADCGYSSRATFSPEVHPSIVWEKFRALVHGAQLATKELWP
jgi:5-methyltetrahydropteroyltriglutamate--homocysteine methyltransferase